MKRITDKFELEDGRRVILHTESWWMLMGVHKDSPTSIEFNRLGFLEPKFDSKPLALDEDEWFTIDKSDFDNFVSAAEIENHQPTKLKGISPRLLNSESRINSAEEIADGDVVMVLKPNQHEPKMMICQCMKPFGLIVCAAFTENPCDKEAIHIPEEEGKFIAVTDIDFLDIYMFRVNPLQGMVNILRYAVEV
jgi:hypothetical protein